MSKNSSLSFVCGQPIRITVAEPYPFTSPDGKQLIIARIVDVPNEEELLVETDYDISLNQATGRFLVLRGRYKSDFLFDLMVGLEMVVVNVLLVPEADLLETVSIHRRKAVFVIIGNAILEEQRV